MRELLLFITGNITAIIYFAHLYFQLANLAAGRKISFYFTFPTRFSVLALLLGSLFYFYGGVGIYCMAGLLTGRFLMLYLHSSRGLF